MLQPVQDQAGSISTCRQNYTRATANKSFHTQLERNDLRTRFRVAHG